MKYQTFSHVPNHFHKYEDEIFKELAIRLVTIIPVDQLKKIIQFDKKKYKAENEPISRIEYKATLNI